MMFNEQLQNPPIKEAIFSVIFKEEISIQLINSFSSSEYISQKYPVKKPNIVLKSQFYRNKKFHISDFDDGIILENKFFGWLIKLNKKGLSYHILKGYESWDKMFSEFKALCHQLEIGNESIEAQEIFVRYINHIPFDESDDIRELFKLLPAEVEGLPKEINNIFLQMKLSEGSLNGLITETINKTKDGLYFIIDLRVGTSLQCFLPDGQLWVSFEEIRGFKNRLFFSIITEKTKQKFL